MPNLYANRLIIDDDDIDAQKLQTVLCALYEEAPVSIPGMTNSGNELKIDSVIVPRNEFRCSLSHNTGNSLLCDKVIGVVDWHIVVIIIINKNYNHTTNYQA